MRRTNSATRIFYYVSQSVVAKAGRVSRAWRADKTREGRYGKDAPALAGETR